MPFGMVRIVVWIVCKRQLMGCSDRGENEGMPVWNVIGTCAFEYKRPHLDILKGYRFKELGTRGDR